MRKKSVVVVSNTIYQLLVLLQMKLTVFKDMDVDLFVTDWSVDIFKYVENGKKLNLFRDIRYIETLEYVKKYGKYEQKDAWGEIKYCMGRYQEVKKIVGKIEKYDYFFNANMSVFEYAFYDVLKRKNKRLKLYLFEEGLATYRAMDAHLINDFNNIFRGKYSIIYKLTGYGKALKNIEGVFLFSPQFCSWKLREKFYKIPKISKENVDTIEKINSLFGYRKLDGDMLQKKVIFFEDGLYEDGFHLNDVQLLDTIAEYVGAENILVKLHPRSRKDRFPAYPKFPDIGIPWEVFYLNGDLADAKLVTVLSGSVIQPPLAFGDKREVVILWDVSRGYFKKIMKEEEQFMQEKIFKKLPKIFRIMKSEEELKSYFCEYAKKISGVKE